MKKFVIFALLVSLVVCSSFGITATAAEYSKINIADYVSGKEYSGDEVIVSYDIPLKPYTEVWSLTGDGNRELVSSGDYITFENSTETQTITAWELIADLGVFESANSVYNIQKDYDWSNLPLSSVTAILVDGVMMPVSSVYTETENTTYRYLIQTYSLQTDGFSGFPFYSGYAVKCSRYYRIPADAYDTYTVGYHYPSSSTGPFNVSIGLLSPKEVVVPLYETIDFNTLLMGNNYENVNLIDLSDIKSGSNFTLSFDYTCEIEREGEIGFEGATFTAHYLDKSYKEVSTTTGELDLQYIYDLNGLPYFTHTIDFMVPKGAEYFWLEFDSGDMAVSSLQKMSWSFQNMTMSCALSAIEDSSKTQQQILNKLDKIDGTLDDYVNGDHGFDSSGSDFSGAAGDLQNSSNQMNDAMSGGMNHLGTMMNSVDFTTTLTTLGTGMNALFEGHEVTICGVTANPFELLVTILAIAILLPLALKFIFRKWGSGSSGGGSDA